MLRSAFLGSGLSEVHRELRPAGFGPSENDNVILIGRDGQI
jgi:hypothetical protein